MKRILSVCILAAMLLSMFTLSTFSAFALDEELEATEMAWLASVNEKTTEICKKSRTRYKEH